MKELNVVFCGTPDCAVPALDHLLKMEQVNICRIVTMPDRPAGRGQKLCAPPIARFAQEKNLPLLQSPNINKDPHFNEMLEKSQPDIIIVFAFAQFLKQSILSAPKLGCFNIHTSLLPKYRGAAPIQYALLNGDSETGISIQRMVSKMDAGDIALAKKIIVDPSDRTPSLTQKLQSEIVPLLDQFIKKLLNDEIEYHPQDETAVSFAPTIKKEDGHIYFKKLTYHQIENRLRAFSPWPGLFCFLEAKRIKILEICPSDLTLAPGQVSTRYETFSVGCKEGTIRLATIQLEGKKCCCDCDFINGFKNIIPKELP